MGQAENRDPEFEAPTSQELAGLRLKPRRWPLLVGLLGLLVVGASVAAFMLTQDRREPKRVLLALDVDGYFWQGSAAAAKLVDELAPELEKRGFVAVGAGDPELLERLATAETPEDAAKLTGAAYIVTGKLGPGLAEHPESGFEMKLRGELSLQHYRGAPSPIGTVSAWAYAPERDVAQQLATEAAVADVFNATLSGLLAHEEIKKLLEGDDAIARGQLTSAKAYLDKRAGEEKRVADEYAKLLKEHADSEQGTAKVTYHGKLEERATLAAVTRRGALVKRDTVRAYFHPKTETLARANELEGLYWVKPGAAPELVAEAIDMWSYPSSSADGAVVAWIEALGGDELALHAVRGTADRRLSSTRDRISEPKVSPAGSRIAYWKRTCGSCPAAIVVVGSTDGKVQAETDGAQGSIAGFAWLGEASLAVLYRPTAGCGYAERCDPPPEADGGQLGQQLVQIELTGPTPRFSVLYQGSPEENLSSPSSSADGQRILMQRNTVFERGLALFERSTQALQNVNVGFAAEPTIAPDGKRGVFIGSGDVALVDFASLAVVYLTQNPRADRYPLFGPDGKVVYFERRDRDPLASKEQVTLVASVPVP